MLNFNMINESIGGITLKIISAHAIVKILYATHEI